MEIVNEEKTIKCCYCKTFLKYTAKDIRTTFFVKKPYIKCPVCGAKLLRKFSIYFLVIPNIRFIFAA